MHAADQLTRAGTVLGTAGYLSPEQIKGEEPGPRSDLYALGCLFFEALTGQAPFYADNEMALHWAHANDLRPKASAYLPSLEDRYDNFLSRALAIDPDDRFASGAEFAEALAAAHGRDTSATTTEAAAVSEPGNGRPSDGETAADAATAVPYTPTTFGPLAPTPPQSQTPQPAPSDDPGPLPSTPEPPRSRTTRAGNPLALVLLALVALAGIAVGVSAATGAFSSSTATPAARALRAALRASAHAIRKHQSSLRAKPARPLRKAYRPSRARAANSHMKCLPLTG